MSKKNKKEQKRERKWIAGCEHKSDQRTADFAPQLGDVQNQLCDLINDMRTFEHYSEIEDAGWCLMTMQKLKRKYRKFADEGVWPETS